MAYKNFQTELWSKYIETELGKNCVLLEDCNTMYEGEIKHASRVKIQGVIRPTLIDYTGESLGEPESIADSSVYLEIEKAKAFNFVIDDIEKAQTEAKVMETLTEEATKAMAEARDTYIASKAVDAGLLSESCKVTNAEEAKKAVDEAFIWLWSNGVKINSDVSIVLPPWYYSLFKDNLSALFTDNVDMLKSGVIGMYNGAKVKLSDNLYNDGTDDLIMIRTKKAIAFAGQLKEVEAYRPHDLFADAVKGLDVYGAKVIRPKEMYVIKAHRG